jgi:RNA polymerase sigma factor (sigma-70 family)
MTESLTLNTLLYADALPPLDRKTERAYIHLAQKSPSPSVRRKAKDMLVRSNLRFLGVMAMRWASALNQDALDLAAEARMHMLRAVDKYDLDKHSVRFLSFSAWDILNAFQEVRRRSPLMKGAKGVDISNLIMSLDAELPNGDEGDTMTLGEMVKDELNPHRALSEEDMQHARHEVRKLLRNLDPVQVEMLERRFGILPEGAAETSDGVNDLESQSLVELAESFGVTPQSMGSAYHKTLRKLRSRFGPAATYSSSVSAQ